MSLLSSVLCGTRFSRAAFLFLSAGLATSSAHAVTLLDSFGDNSLDTAAWVFGSTNGGGSAAVTSGSLALSSGHNGGSQRSAIVTKSTNINPFANPITISLSGISISSASTVGTSRGSVIVGRNATHTAVDLTPTETRNMSSDGGQGAGGGAIGLNYERNNTANTYAIRIVDMGSDNSGLTYALSAAPTDIVWTLDFTGSTFTYTLALTGAVITSITGDQGSAVGAGTSTATYTIHESFAKFTSDDLLVGSDSISRLFFNSLNAGGLDTGTTSLFSIDSITVSAVPEPSTYALIASAFICGFVVIRRRRMQQAS